MKNFAYFELVTFFYSHVLTNIASNNSPEMAIALAFDNYFYEEVESDFFENWVIIISSINMKNRFKLRTPRMGVELFFWYLKTYESGAICIKDHLNKEEQEHFLEVLNDAKHYMKQYME
ncbi:hypothetical protein ACKLNQ_15985 [Myroides odoratimimus]|uniref:hypothetical protein n=1 Tax=Myroides odoratimimus TaxID=76832 RepID=UPI0038D4E333